MTHGRVAATCAASAWMWRFVSPTLSFFGADVSDPEHLVSVPWNASKLSARRAEYSASHASGSLRTGDDLAVRVDQVLRVVGRQREDQHVGREVGRASSWRSGRPVEVVRTGEPGTDLADDLDRHVLGTASRNAEPRPTEIESPATVTLSTGRPAAAAAPPDAASPSPPPGFGERRGRSSCRCSWRARPTTRDSARPDDTVPGQASTPVPRSRPLHTRASSRRTAPSWCGTTPRDL